MAGVFGTTGSVKRPARFAALRVLWVEDPGDEADGGAPPWAFGGHCTRNSSPQPLQTPQLVPQNLGI